MPASERQEFCIDKFGNRCCCYACTMQLPEESLEYNALELERMLSRALAKKKGSNSNLIFNELLQELTVMVNYRTQKVIAEQLYQLIFMPYQLECQALQEIIEKEPALTF